MKKQKVKTFSKGETETDSVRHFQGLPVFILGNSSANNTMKFLDHLPKAFRGSCAGQKLVVLTMPANRWLKLAKRAVVANKTIDEILSLKLSGMKGGGK
jgi:hypothetical protein